MFRVQYIDEFRLHREGSYRVLEIEAETLEEAVKVAHRVSQRCPMACPPVAIFDYANVIIGILTVDANGNTVHQLPGWPTPIESIDVLV